MDGINWEQNAPYAFIQWKGTDVCLDWHCACGEQYHLDASFLYAVQCGACQCVYALEPFVRLVANRDGATPVVCMPDDER